MELPIIGPRGYAPDGVPNTCTGRTFWATDKWQNLEASIGATPWPASSANDPRQAAYCHWLVRSTTAGRKILTEVTKIIGNECANQCTRGFLSVRVNPDWGKPEIR